VGGEGRDEGDDGEGSGDCVDAGEGEVEWEVGWEGEDGSGDVEVVGEEEGEGVEREEVGGGKDRRGEGEEGGGYCRAADYMRYEQEDVSSTLDDI
jgi:hypothetical protein